ncbi:glycosyltransferase family 2 protein [Henriciella sp. AS95]|uniref:glycosyltransferase family 2 protein n=1 Tax=Henriciella sp. AS95 TaxID=3135782 RepID=UPI003178F35F
MTISPTAKITVIIVNYNGGEYIHRSIDTLRHQQFPAHEVIIVDNASTDGSVDDLELGGLDNARLIRLDENLGFARANNIAAEQASGDWLALLNPDALAEPDWLSQLMKAAGRHPGVNMFASAQLDADNPQILDGAGDAYHVLGVPWRGGFGRPASELPGEGECFSPCGASALFKRDTFLEAGGFTESFFCYCEDVDLGFRLRLGGETCVFVPDAVVRHHGSAISGRYSDFTVRLGTRNRLKTYLTNMPPLALALTLPGHLLASLYLYIRAIGKSHAKAMRQGFTEGLLGLPGILKDRRKAQRTRTRSSLDLVRAMTWNPVTLHNRLADVRPFAEDAARSGKRSLDPLEKSERP